jgi:hypothetical protein
MHVFLNMCFKVSMKPVKINYIYSHQSDSEDMVKVVNVLHESVGGGAHSQRVLDNHLTGMCFTDFFG